MAKKDLIHFFYVPWTGLGLYNGFRGNRWLKNRIKIFKQFVIPSLQAQTCKDFILLCSWRPEEKNNPHVKELIHYLSTIEEFKTIHTFHGILFYDDKYEDSIAIERLTNNLHYTMGDLYDFIADSEHVLMTIQPSDDLYDKHAVETLQYMFETTDLQAVGFSKGYIINYWNKEVAEYNPNTNPPFYTIKFPTKDFTDPLRHLQYTSLKKDAGKYKKGTPLPSHEYVGDCLKYGQIDERGFMVGTHGANISTTWQIPFKGSNAPAETLKDFGIYDVSPITLKLPLKRKLYLLLPYKAQRKIRYWLTEKFKFKNPLKKFWFWRNYTTNQHKLWWKMRKIDWDKEYLQTCKHPHRRVIAHFLGQVKWNNLIEVGCGSGANLVNIVNIFPGKYLAGVDVNKDALDLAKQVFRNVNP